MNQEEGIEILKIFKDHDVRTSILDDFGYYDDKERIVKERKARQQASSMKDVPHLLADDSIEQISGLLSESLHLEDGNENKQAQETNSRLGERLHNKFINQSSDSFSVDPPAGREG